jgi:hypothetical protein
VLELSFCSVLSVAPVSLTARAHREKLEMNLSSTSDENFVIFMCHSLLSTVRAGCAYEGDKFYIQNLDGETYWLKVTSNNEMAG